MFEIGKITTTHGIKGEVKVINLSDFDRFVKGEKVFLMFNNERIDLTIENVRNQVKNLIVKFKEYGNINEVINYRGLTIYSDTRGELEDDEFYISDLYDLEVYDLTDNSLIGIVQNVLELPHGEVLDVYNRETNKRSLIPFEKEFIVEVTDTKIKVKPIEGLLW